MNYQGQGKLIGYKSYTKDNVTKHIYYVLNGTMDKQTQLYSDLEFLTIVQTEQTLTTITPQNVSFEVSASNFNGKTYNRYTNILSLEVKKL